MLQRCRLVQCHQNHQRDAGKTIWSESKQLQDVPQRQESTINMLTLNTNVQMASLVPKYICHYQVSPATPRQSDEDFLSYCFQMSFINSNQFSTLSYLHKNMYCGCLANIKSFSVMIKNYSEVIRKQYIQTNIHTVPCKG